MKREAVDSSNIKSIGYDPETQVLEVEFNYRGGTVYRYKGVPMTVHAGLMEAESKGKFLNSEVKGTYEYEQVAVDS